MSSIAYFFIKLNGLKSNFDRIIKLTLLKLTISNYFTVLFFQKSHRYIVFAWSTNAYTELIYVISKTYPFSEW